MINTEIYINFLMNSIILYLKTSVSSIFYTKNNIAYRLHTSKNEILRLILQILRKIILKSNVDVSTLAVLEKKMTQM